MFIDNEKLSQYPEYANYRKMVALVDAGIVGTDEARAFLVPVDVTEEMLSEAGWNMAVDHAYGIYFSENVFDIDEEDGNEYSDQMGTSWEVYDADKHDGLLIFGNARSFQWEVY